jgi:glycosyltransferase involved in cell wall biosynthesis
MTVLNEPKLRLCLAAQMFYPTYGGSTLRFLRYLPGFQERGIDCCVLTGTPLSEEATAAEDGGQWGQCPIGDMLPIEEVNGTPIHRVRLPAHKGMRRTRLFNQALLQHCMKPEYRPEVVQLVGTLRLKSVPGLSRLRAMGIPLVYAVTNTSKLISKTNRSRLRQAVSLRRWRYRQLFNYMDCIVVNNTPMLELMRAMGVTARIEAIPNGVNLQRFRVADDSGGRRELRERLGIGDGEFMITTVGAVMPRKGSDLLLEAWVQVNRKLGNSHLVFVGPRKDLENPRLTDFRDRLAGLVNESGTPERVHFVGLADEVETYLQASDLFVLASRREGMPNSVIEAMACATPVIITPFLGLSDDLGKAGEQYLLSDFEPDTLAGLMTDVLTNADLRTSLRRSGRQWIEQTMDLRHSLDRYAALYRELAGRRRENI